MAHAPNHVGKDFLKMPVKKKYNGWDQEAVYIDHGDCGCGGVYEYDYLMFRPDKHKDMMKTGERLPLVIFLSGSLESKNKCGLPPDKSLEIVRHLHGPPQLINEGRFPPGTEFMVASPQHETYTYTAPDLAHFIRKMIDTYPVDQSRVYITGVSCTGNSILNLVAEEPDTASKIAAAAVCDAFFYSENAPEVEKHIIPECKDTIPSTQKLIRKISNRGLPFPVWVFHSHGDTWNRSLGVMDGIALLWETYGASGKLRVTFFREGHHGSCLKRVYDNSGLYNMHIVDNRSAPFDIPVYKWFAGVRNPRTHK